MNPVLYRNTSNAAGRNDHLFAVLQTEAAVWPSGRGHADEVDRLAGSIAEVQFESMIADRLLAEILLPTRDDLRVSIQPAIAGPDHAKAAPNKQTHGEEQAKPGNLGEHVVFLSYNRLGTSAAGQKAEAKGQRDTNAGRDKEPDVHRNGFLHGLRSDRFRQTERGESELAVG